MLKSLLLQVLGHGEEVEAGAGTAIGCGAPIAAGVALGVAPGEEGVSSKRCKV